MARSKRESVQNRIVQFYLDVAKRKNDLTMNQFLQAKIPRQTIYNIIKKHEKFGCVGDRRRSDRPKKLTGKKRLY
jgi:hypothetical protein